MKSKSFYLWFSFISIHVFIAFVAFLHFRLDPFHQTFCNTGDGLKNNFTLISYVKEPITIDGIFKFNAFSYPFGDYVYYTDNTPLFSIPFRWVCLHIHDFSSYTLIAFYIFVISNILVSGILLYKIFNHFLDRHFLSYIMAIILPWANVQVLRVWHGHYSLSFSSLSLLAICLVMLWHKYRYQLSRQIVIAISMILLAILSFLAHGYYLAIITLFIAAILFFYGLFNRREKFGKFTLCVSFIYPVFAFGFTMLLLFVTDKYLALRKDTANGYDNLYQKTRLYALYNHYNFQKIFFPFYYDLDTTDPDQAAYLGNVGLYAVLIILIIVVLNKRFRSTMIGIQKDFFKDPLKASILLGSLIMLSVSLGEVYRTAVSQNEYGYRILNIFNPLLYVHYFTNRVEQFRCLERFMWPFFFAFYIWVMYTIVAIYRQSERKVKIWIVVGILFLGGVELDDFVNTLQHRTDHENYLSAADVAKTTPGHLDPRNYQAILPIPYYFVGSENYDITLDDDNDWSTYTFRLQLNTGLPLMSCKMSRSPLSFNTTLIEFVAYDSLSKELKAKLTHKPILVAVKRSLLTDMSGTNIPHGENQLKLYNHALQFVDRHHLQPVDSAEGVFFYNYFPL